MRLWSVHPKYLDTKGLVACWREGLLARKVLLDQTKGYRNHPQLERFRSCKKPVEFIDAYLRAVVDESLTRGYRFDRSKIGPRFTIGTIDVTTGQLAFEFTHLKQKIEKRDPLRLHIFRNAPEPHPLFRIVEGEIESWERV